MRRARAALLGAVLAMFGVAASTASAGSDFWISGTLGNGFGFASTDAHSITYIQGVTNSNGFCIAKDQGLAGYGSSSRVPVGTEVCATSGGFVNRNENGSCCYHGWISNKNSGEISVFGTTRYDF